MDKQNLPARVDELLTEVVNKDPLVLASISAVPYFGSTLATFFSAKWLQIYQERTSALFERFAEHLNSIDERTIKRDYFDSPEGIDLLIKATEQSTKTRSKEKRDLIARILAGATSSYSEQGNYSPEEYINLVATLTAKELKVARTIRTLQQNVSAKDLEPENKAETWRQCEEAIRERHSIDSSDLPLILNRLYNVGLMELFYVPTWTTSKPTYWTSPTFERLMEFLRLEA